MQLLSRWTNKESWAFHIKDKGIVREYIDESNDSKEPTLEKFEQMEFRREWMENDGEGNPPNYELLKSIADEFQHKVESGEFKPSFLEKKVYLKFIFFCLTNFKQDSAYRERMGGWLSVTMLDPTPWLACKLKEERIAYFRRLQKWWQNADERKRTKPWINTLIEQFIKHYTSSTFVEEGTNWFYDTLVEHRADWKIDSIYDCNNWYPKGRGYIQNKIRGGRG